MEIRVLVLAIMALISFNQEAIASCTDDSDRASDGSRCGKRSSDSRPRGK